MHIDKLNRYKKHEKQIQRMALTGRKDVGKQRFFLC